MEITSAQIKALRETTGVAVMQCKKALEEAGGDMEKARVILRKKGSEAVVKKADRTLGAGTIAAYVHTTGGVAALGQLSCETDFRSRVILRKKGSEAVVKKADRTLGAGTIAAYVHTTGGVAALVQLSCETDFVSKNARSEEQTE